MAHIIAIVGANSGSGGTSVSAHLSAALQTQGKSVLAIDCCPNNVLRLYFGMRWDDGQGFARALLDDKPWHEAAYCNSIGVRFLPFGHLKNDSELKAICNLIDTHPQWLLEHIERLDLPPETLVICDCPRYPNDLYNHVVNNAHMMVVVMQPEPIALSNAQKQVKNHLNLPSQICYILVNGLDMARTLDRDVVDLLQAHSKEDLVPVMIHRDEYVREALAFKQTLLEYAPFSQANHDFQSLAIWIIARALQWKLPE